jgi:hypothetical protein
VAWRQVEGSRWEGVASAAKWQVVKDVTRFACRAAMLGVEWSGIRS